MLIATCLLLLFVNSYAQIGDCLQGDCKNGNGVLVTSDKTRYEGDFKNSEIVKGKCIFTDGSIFEGLFKNALPNGFGNYREPAKRMRFTGNFEMGFFTGVGLAVFGLNETDSISIKGSWTKNVLNGKALFIYKKGKITEYTAECISKNTQPAPGAIKIKFADGRTYTGMIAEDNRVAGNFLKNGKLLPEGKGNLFANIDDIYAFYLETGKTVKSRPEPRKNVSPKIYADGSTYTGEWQDSLRHGTGTYVWANGHKYIGQWKNGVREGRGIKYDNESKVLQDGTWVKGIFTVPEKMTFYGNEKEVQFDEGLYTGQIVNDRPNGFGKFKLKNGSESEGEWKNGTMDGWGVYRFYNGPVYEGMFNIKPNGFGIMVYANGNYYEGEWKDGKYNGRGYFYNAEKGKYDGEWKQGSKEGNGVFVWNNGEWYKGEFKQDNQHGKGIKYNKTGKPMQNGIWENGVFQN